MGCFKSLASQNVCTFHREGGHVFIADVPPVGQ